MSNDHDIQPPDPEDCGSFAVRLFHARSSIPLTQEELAERAGIPGGASAIGHYEAGRREPGLDNLRRLVWALGQSADYLLATRPATDEPYKERLCGAADGLPPPQRKPAEVRPGQLWRLHEIYADVVPATIVDDVVTFEIGDREFTASARRMLSSSSWTFHGVAG